VIDLSPPINALETADLDPQGLLRLSPAEKKDGPGGFAKLLAGLLRNLRGSPDAAAGKTAGSAGLSADTPLDPETAELAASPGGRGKAAEKAKNLRGKGQALFPEAEASPEELSLVSAGLNQLNLKEAPPPEPAGETSANQAALELSFPELALPERPDRVSPESREAPSAEIPPEGGPAAGEGAAEAPALAAAKAGEEPEAPEERGGPARKRARAAASAGAEEGAFRLEGGLSGETAAAEGRGAGAPAETRPRDKRRDRAALGFRDLRTASAGGDPHGSAGSAGPAGPAAGESPPPGREAELVVELSPGEGSREADTEPESGPPRDFRDLLARELRQNLNDDIVRHASILLRDGGEGTIRLALKPESLGNVKIRLEMAENKIAGKITVESDEALRAFEGEIRALEQAFRDSGFDGASLEMAVTADGGERRQWQGEEGKPFFSERIALRQAASGYDAAAEQSGDALPVLAGNPGFIRVDMLV
jgi:hypothetical protein